MRLEKGQESIAQGANSKLSLSGLMLRVDTCHKYSLHGPVDKYKSGSDSPLLHKVAKEKRKKGKKKIKLN